MEISITYYYHRGDKGGDDLSSSISRHHVISYPRMYYLGVLALCYLKSEPKKNGGKVKILKDACRNQRLNIEETLKHINNCGKGEFSIPSDKPIVRDVLNELAWMPVNLFTGPSGKLRIDDPSQRNESFPEKMPKNQKKALENIIGGLNDYSHSFIPHIEGEGGPTRSVHFKNKSDFEKLVEIYFDNIIQKKTCYDSELSDWRIATDYYLDGDIYRCGNRTNYYRFFFATGNERSEKCIHEYEEQRLLAFGKFVKMNPLLREHDNTKVFKVLEIGDEYLKGIIKNRDSEQFRTWEMPIKDFLK